MCQIQKSPFSKKNNNTLIMDQNSSNLIRSRFTRSFLQALKKINTPSSNYNSPREMYVKYRRVKSAADKSLALAVKSRRVMWRRALLWRLRRRRLSSSKRRRIKTKKKKILEDSTEENELRKLVPGGEGMDLCSLLEETGHYMKCLNTQVYSLMARAN